MFVFKSFHLLIIFIFYSKLVFARVRIIEEGEKFIDTIKEQLLIDYLNREKVINFSDASRGIGHLADVGPDTLKLSKNMEKFRKKIYHKETYPTLGSLCDLDTYKFLFNPYFEMDFIKFNDRIYEHKKIESTLSAEKTDEKAYSLCQYSGIMMQCGENMHCQCLFKAAPYRYIKVGTYDCENNTNCIRRNEEATKQGRGFGRRLPRSPQNTSNINENANDILNTDNNAQNLNNNNSIQNTNINAQNTNNSVQNTNINAQNTNNSVQNTNINTQNTNNNNNVQNTNINAQNTKNNNNVQNTNNNVQNTNINAQNTNNSVQNTNINPQNTNSVQNTNINAQNSSNNVQNTNINPQNVSNAGNNNNKKGANSSSAGQGSSNNTVKTMVGTPVQRFLKQKEYQHNFTCVGIEGSICSNAPNATIGCAKGLNCTDGYCGGLEMAAIVLTGSAKFLQNCIYSFTISFLSLIIVNQYYLRFLVTII